MAELLDSGARREFGNGAVRDVAEGKGRCDLLPLKVAGHILEDSNLMMIDSYVRSGIVQCLLEVVRAFSNKWYADVETAMLEVAKQYEDGARKYADRNWEKGIPVHVFIDSGVRHYLKFLRGDKDEPHDRAFIWNMLGAIWTHENKPELIDLPFADKPTTTNIPPETLEELFRGYTNTAIEPSEPVKGKYDGLSNFELDELFCPPTPCSKCPVLVRARELDISCNGFIVKHPEEFRKIAIEWLNKQDELEGKA